MQIEATQVVQRPETKVSSVQTVSSAPSSSTNVKSHPSDGGQGKVGALTEIADEIQISSAVDASSGDVRELSQEETLNDLVQSKQDRADQLKQEAQDEEEDRLTQFTEEANSKLNQNLSLRFRRDEETGTEVFQLVEQDTGEVVRQVPSEEVLEFMQKFEESVTGLFVSKQA